MELSKATWVALFYSLRESIDKLEKTLANMEGEEEGWKKEMCQEKQAVLNLKRRAQQDLCENMPEELREMYNSIFE